MLALWEYFWVTTDWTGAPAPTPTPSTTRPKGSGASRKQQRGEYTAADDEFWALRERYLRRFAPPVATDTKVIATDEAITNPSSTPSTTISTMEEPPPVGGSILLQQALDAALLRARTATNAATLRDAVMRARKLALDISEINTQHYNRAIALLLLLDAF